MGPDAALLLVRREPAVLGREKKRPREALLLVPEGAGRPEVPGQLLEVEEEPRRVRLARRRRLLGPLVPQLEFVEEKPFLLVGGRGLGRLLLLVAQLPTLHQPPLLRRKPDVERV